MCGIAGYWGKFDAKLAERMLSKLLHRGPDDSGIWNDYKMEICLLQARLSIIDLSPNGHQPMVDIQASNVITYNGELYNFKELRCELEDEGYKFRSTSDTEVMLKMYDRYGIDMLHRLNGIFAFAIWDQNERALFVAKDAFGVKPLYYTSTENGFLFASELKALLEEPKIKRELNPIAIQSYMTYLWCPAPQTPLKGVFKLEPGQALLLKDGHIKKSWYYWDFPYKFNHETVSLASTVSTLRDKLYNAVERQLVSDVPVGAFLSGGLDSSAVVAMAKKIAPQKELPCFSIDCDFGKDGFSDDLPYARRVASYLGTPLHVVKVDPSMIKKLPQMIYYMDEPQADPAPLNVLFISELARKHGIKVLLSGAGGDDIFSGYRRHHALMLERWWCCSPLAIRVGLKNISRLSWQNKAFIRRITKAFQYSDLNQTKRLVSYFYWTDPTLVKSLLTETTNYNDDIFLESNNSLHKTLTRISDDVHPLNKMLYLEGKHFLSDHNLNYTDKMSMATGVEVRVPLLDIELVEFACGLPVKYKQRGHEGKWIFKKSMEGILPNEVIYRPKSGFGAPIRHWLHHDLKSFVDNILSKTKLSERGIFNPKAVENLIQKDRLNIVDGTYTIFSLICIEIWCKLFIDGDTPDSLNIN